MKVEITKCYLVQVMDDDGNEIGYEYVFCDNKKVAEQVGRELLKEAEKNKEGETE